MHKYSRLASSSYDYFNSRGKIDAVHEGLQNSKHNYIDDLKNFTVDEELSTIDNLVLHNSKTLETSVSYRGTTDNPLRTKSFLKHWRINGQIAGGKSIFQKVFIICFDFYLISSSILNRQVDVVSVIRVQLLLLLLD